MTKAAAVSPEAPLLTLAIPTYNRAGFLRQNLETLFEQLVKEPRMELIISDNCSTDATPELVTEFQQRGLSIRYLRNTENLGSNGNILQCYDQARGKYAWVMGDDDIVVPGGIRRILDLLEQDSYGLVFLTPFVFHDDYRSQYQPRAWSQPARVIDDSVSFIRNVGQLFLFTTSMIINKQECTVDLEAIRPLTTTFLIHMGWQLDRLNVPGKHLLVYETLIGQRVENSSGWGACRVFGVNFMTNLDQLLSPRSRLACEMRKLMLTNWLPHMVMCIREGTAGPLDAEDMRLTLETLYRTSPRYWRYWLYVLPLIELPQGMARRWYALVTMRNRLRCYRVVEAARRRLTAPRQRS